MCTYTYTYRHVCPHFRTINAKRAVTRVNGKQFFQAGEYVENEPPGYLCRASQVSSAGCRNLRKTLGLVLGPYRASILHDPVRVLGELFLFALDIESAMCFMLKL